MAAGQLKTAMAPDRSLAPPLYRRNIDGYGSRADSRGNDALMLKGLPGLSPHAIPAFVAMLFGVGVTLLFMRLLTGQTLQVVCTNDICRTEN